MWRGFARFRCRPAWWLCVGAGWERNRASGVRYKLNLKFAAETCEYVHVLVRSVEVIECRCWVTRPQQKSSGVHKQLVACRPDSPAEERVADSSPRCFFLFAWSVVELRVCARATCYTDIWSCAYVERRTKRRGKYSDKISWYSPLVGIAVFERLKSLDLDLDLDLRRN